MIDLYFANIGSGKTTLLARMAKQELKRIEKGKSKYKYIISNALIAGTTYVPDIREVLKKSAIEDALILIDEASIIYNNRQMKITDKEIQYFKLSRHYNTDIIVVSQSYEDIDITLRRLYNKVYLLNRLPLHFTLIREIKKTIDINEETKQITEAYAFLPLIKYLFKPIKFFKSCFLFRYRYYNMFNTHWRPSDVPIADLTKFEVMPKVEKVTFKQKIDKSIDDIKNVSLYKKLIKSSIVETGTITDPYITEKQQIQNWLDLEEDPSNPF